MKASKLTARSLAYALRAVGRKIAKEYRASKTPHGKQSVKKLMAHGVATNSIELSGDTKTFDRVARKWNVDYGPVAKYAHKKTTSTIPKGLG